MKKQLSKKALWQTLLSTGVLGIFLVLAAGSGLQFGWMLDVWEKSITDTEILDKGKRKTTVKIQMHLRSNSLKVLFSLDCEKAFASIDKSILLFCHPEPK